MSQYEIRGLSSPQAIEGRPVSLVPEQFYFSGNLFRRIENKFHFSDRLVLYCVTASPQKKGRRLSDINFLKVLNSNFCFMFYEYRTPFTVI